MNRLSSFDYSTLMSRDTKEFPINIIQKIIELKEEIDLNTDR